MTELLPFLSALLRMFDRTAELQLAVGHIDQKLTQQHHTTLQRISNVMATQQQFEAALTRVEAATTAGATAATAIGARITSLEDAIRNAGLPKATEDALLAKTEGLAVNAEALAAALQPMGQNATEPVPVEPPPPVPVDPPPAPQG